MSPRPRYLSALLVLTRHAGGGPTRDPGRSGTPGGGWQVGTAPALCEPRAQHPSSDPAFYPRPDPCTADRPCPLQGHRDPAGNQSSGSSQGRRAQLPGVGGPTALGQPQTHAFGLRAASTPAHTLSLPCRSPRQGFSTGVPANPWGCSSYPAMPSHGLKEAEATPCTVSPAASGSLNSARCPPQNQALSALSSVCPSHFPSGPTWQHGLPARRGIP